MVAIDTNVLVRLVTNDDPEQAERAATLFEAHDVFVPKTVVLESEWVLRYAYRLPRDAILGALRGVLGLPNATVESAADVARALGWFEEEGVDFADALHVASSQRAERFATFDEKLIKRSRGLAGATVMAVPKPGT